MEYLDSDTSCSSWFYTFYKTSVSGDPVGCRLLLIGNISCFVLLFCTVRYYFLYRQSVLLPILFVVVFPFLFFHPERILPFGLAFWPFFFLLFLHPLVHLDILFVSFSY